MASSEGEGHCLTEDGQAVAQDFNARNASIFQTHV